MINNQSYQIPTRESLLSRLKDRDNQEGWKDFFDTYWKLIYRAATEAGLNAAEAQEVVQETVLSVFRRIPEFRYNRKAGSFKGWLLHLTRWRIRDQVRKRENLPSLSDEEVAAEAEEVPVEEPNLEEFWNLNWEKNAFDAAVERTKKKVSPKNFQIYDLHVLKGWDVTRVCLRLRVRKARVYYVKHRVGAVIKKQLRAIEREEFL